MTLEDRATEIADEADDCCNRGGDWWRRIYLIALNQLRASHDLPPVADQVPRP